MSNMVVQTNVLALNSHRNMKNVGALQAKASQKLSSGYRVNSAADDAAGLAISEKMRAQIRGLDMASKNAQDAQSLIQTAEGGMQEIDNMLQRIRELVVQASNDTNEQNGTEGDRTKIQDEINQLVTEIDSMADRVEFNKKKVIDGTYSATPPDKYTDQAVKDAFDLAKAAFTTASDNAITASDNLKNAPTVDWDATSDAFDTFTNDALEGLSSAYQIAYSDLDIADASAAGSAAIIALTSALSTAAGAEYSALLSDVTIGNAGDISDAIDALISKLDTAVDDIADAIDTENIADQAGLTADSIQAIKDSLAAWADKLYTAATSNNVPLELADANAKLALADATANLATASAALTDVTEPGDAGGLYFQVGANKDQGWSLNIGSVKTDKLGGIGDGNGSALINVLEATGSGALTATISDLDTALTYVTTERSKLGAAYNRLEYTMKSLDVSSENLSAAESRIRDTDMAKEMMNLTKANVLQQASVSMLAQANQAPQSILQLLQ